MVFGQGLAGFLLVEWRKGMNESEPFLEGAALRMKENQRR